MPRRGRCPHRPAPMHFLLCPRRGRPPGRPAVRSCITPCRAGPMCPAARHAPHFSCVASVGAGVLDSPPPVLHCSVGWGALTPPPSPAAPLVPSLRASPQTGVAIRPPHAKRGRFQRNRSPYALIPFRPDPWWRRRSDPVRPAFPPGTRSTPGRRSWRRCPRTASGAARTAARLPRRRRPSGPRG